jgi:hypothetical protein
MEKVWKYALGSSTFGIETRFLEEIDGIEAVVDGTGFVDFTRELRPSNDEEKVTALCDVLASGEFATDDEPIDDSSEEQLWGDDYCEIDDEYSDEELAELRKKGEGE